MDLDVLSKAFKELGHPARLRIYVDVMRAGLEGVSVGTLKESLDIPGSTLSHHLAALKSAGVIHQNRIGTTLYCCVSEDMHRLILDFFQNECCVETPDT